MIHNSANQFYTETQIYTHCHQINRSSSHITGFLCTQIDKRPRLALQFKMSSSPPRPLKKNKMLLNPSTLVAGHKACYSHCLEIFIFATNLNYSYKQEQVLNE